MQSRLSAGPQAPSSSVSVTAHPLPAVPKAPTRSHRRYQHDPNFYKHFNSPVPQAACRAAASLAVVSRLTEQEGFSRASLPELQFRDMDAVEVHNCPCGSHKLYSACCGPVLSGSAATATTYGPPELARARFTAHLLANLDFLERTMHPDNPEHGHPQMVARACAVFQALDPKLLDLCHAHVPGSEDTGEEAHIVATALMVKRDSTASAHVFVEVDRYQLRDGSWQHHSREHHLPTFGPFLIFMDKYGPGSSRGDRAAAGGGGEHSIIVGGGRYKYDLVSPRTTPTASRGLTPSASRVPSPQLQRRGFTPQVARQQRATPQQQRTHSTHGMLHSPQPQRQQRPGTPQVQRMLPSGSTPQTARGALPGGTPQPPRPRVTPQPHYRKPTPSPSTSQQGTAQMQRTSRGGLTVGAGSGASLAALSSTAGVHSHHLLGDAWPQPATTNSDLVYLDDDESSSGSNTATSLATTSSKHSTAADAQQLSAQQEMMHMVHGAADSTDADSWLFKQSGFRYEV